jgi:thymidylate kinase
MALAELTLGGVDRQPQMVRTLRARTARDILSSSESLVIATRKAAFYCLARLTGRDKPFGRYHRGLLIALSGTDGVGKSTTMSALRAQLDNQQIRSSTVYLGRGRDNLPGIESLRNLVGKKLRKDGPAADVYKYSSLTKAVSWYYAIEYFLRTLRPYIDAKLLGKIVLCDRYIYDIRLVPGHSKAAVWFTRTICPKPDINVCLFAPAEVVRARKAERSLLVIEDQQQVFKSIVESKLARFNSISINTQALPPSEVCQQILTRIHTFCHPDY